MMDTRTESSGWSPALGVGVPEIDRQHEGLFAATGAFLDAEAGARAEQLLALLACLADHIVAHFAVEEAHMRRAGYPGLEAHAREHRAFAATFQRVLAAFARYGDDPRVASLIAREVPVWLERHAATWDMALGEHLRGHVARRRLARTA